jgi:hypothetical protein
MGKSRYSCASDVSFGISRLSFHGHSGLERCHLFKDHRHLQQKMRQARDLSATLPTPIVLE